MTTPLLTLIGKLLVYMLRKKNLLRLGAFMLFAALALHTVYFNHKHPEDLFRQREDRSSAQAAVWVQDLFHGEDRKLWAAYTALAFLFAGLFAATQRSAEVPNTIPAFADSSDCVSSLGDPLREVFRRGILHPKICG